MEGLNFTFSTATKIIFGENAVEKIGELLQGLGNKVLLVQGKNGSRGERVRRLLESGCELSVFHVAGEPDVSVVEAGVALARREQCSAVVGVGGGSVIDCAKAIAALVPNPGEVLDYLEVVGKGISLGSSPLPFVAVPTTAGTGSEVTKNAVIKSNEHRVKVSLRSDAMFPKVAIVDPVMTYSMPPTLTATTGVDALTHLLEAFVSLYANDFVDMLCRKGLTCITASIVRACEHGSDAEARNNMALASLLGGMTLANGKLGAIHGFAGPLGGMLPVPHGAACAGLMAAAVEVNVKALRARGGDLSKFDELAAILMQNPEAKADDLSGWLVSLVNRLRIPSLSIYGLKPSMIAPLVKQAQKSSSMKGNPVQLTEEELTRILEMSF